MIAWKSTNLHLNAESPENVVSSEWNKLTFVFLNIHLNQSLSNEDPVDTWINTTLPGRPI